MNARFFGLIVTAAATLLSFALSARADDVSAYAETTGGGFGEIDLSTGVFTPLGSSGIQLSGTGNYGGVIYGGAYLFDAQPNAFYQINPANGSLTFIGNSSEPFMATGSTTAGVYKLGCDGNLYSMNVTTGASTLIGSTGLPLNGTCCGNGFIGVSANGSSLYINQNESLYLIDTTTGHASLISSTSPAIFTQTLSIDGIRYGASDTGLGGGGREIFTFDPNTDTVTAGPFTNSPQIWGLAVVPGPIVGSGIPGLIFASGGLLAWWPGSGRRGRQLEDRCPSVLIST